MSHKIGSSSHDSLVMLKEGNARYVCGKTEGPNRDKPRRLETFELGQGPAAILVSCSDSRVPPEIVFDMGIGDLFVVRVAGNVCGISEMGSIEYAVAFLHVPLLIVMGHSKCGAITAVVNQERVEGNIHAIAERIAPSVRKIVDAKPGLTGGDLVEECSKENVWHQIEHLLQESFVVRNAANCGHLQIVGAYYNIEHGDVNWMGKHPDEHLLLDTVADLNIEVPAIVEA